MIHPTDPTFAAHPARPYRTLHAVAFAALTTCQVTAIAQEVAPDPGPTPLERVEIRSTPLLGPVLRRDRMAAPVQSASSADIERSGALSLGDFAQRLGSVHLNEIQGNPLQPDVNYRGFTASPLLGTPQGLSVYVDGVRQNQPFGDAVNWDLLPPSAMASMSLMPGSNPLFGLNTLGGALAVVTKDGRSDPGAALQLTLGSQGRVSLETEFGGSSATGWDWYGTTRLLREDGWRDASKSWLGQGFGKVGWRDGVTRISLTGSLAGTQLRGNGLQEQRLLEQDWGSVYTRPDETRNRSAGLTLQFEHALDPELSLSGNAYWQRLKTRTLNGDINEGSLDQSVYALSDADKAALTSAGIPFPSEALTAANTPFPYLRCIAQALQNDEPGEQCNGLINRSTTEQHRGGVSAQVSWKRPLAGSENLFVAGAAWDGSRANYSQTTQLGYLNSDRSVTGTDAWADGVTGGDVDGEPLDNRVQLKSRTRTASLFASDVLSLTRNLHLTLSGRYNRTHVENADAIHPGGGANSLDGDHRYSRFNPAVGLSWSVSPSFSAYASYAEGSRAPTAIELGCANPERPCRLPNAMAGDPPLDAVVTRTIEAGVRGRFDRRTQWELGVFRATNHHDILFVADDQAGFGYFKNFGQTRRQGVEAGLISRQGTWNLSAHYTWLDATFRSDETLNGAGNSTNSEGAGLEGTIDVHKGDRIPLIPRQQLKLAVGWQATPTVELELSGIGVSGSYARGNENNAHEADGQTYFGSGRSAGYAVFDLGGSWRPKTGLRLFAQVHNLFDRHYTTAAQLGNSAFDTSGAFQARPYGGSAATGYPLQGSTFYAPGAPRSLSIGARWDFGAM